jgi:probable HAF family extracellular repeat protein
VRGVRKILVRATAPLIAVAVVPLVGATPAFAYGAPIDLGTLFGGTSNAWAINIREEIVGSSDGMPVIWLHRQINQLPLPAGFVGGSARDINDDGQIVGYVWDDNGLTRAVRWNGTAFVTLLENSAPGGSGAFGINANGTITGFVNEGFGNDPATFAGGTYQRVTPVNGNGSGYTVSGQGVIVGYYFINGTQHAFENGISPPTAGGYLTLPSLACCFRGGAAWAVSADNSKIFGNSTSATGETHPTMWTLGFNSLGWPTWKATDLGVPGGLGTGYINDTNQWGTVSPGAAVTRGGQSIAFYWQSGLGTQTLPSNGNCGNSANAVNGVAQIVGRACGSDGQAHAMLWT